jgi:hypothetical protein
MVKASPKGKAVKGKAGKANEAGKADMVDKGTKGKPNTVESESKEEVRNASVGGRAGLEDPQPSKDNDELVPSKLESKKVVQSLTPPGEKEKAGKGKTDKGGKGAKGKPIGKSEEAESKEDVAAVGNVLPAPEDNSGSGKGKIKSHVTHKSKGAESKGEVKEGKVAVEATEKAGDVVGSLELEGLQTSKGEAAEGGEDNKLEGGVVEVKEFMVKEKGEGETSRTQLMLVRPIIERYTLLKYKTLGSSSAEDYLQTQQVLPHHSLSRQSNYHQHRFYYAHSTPSHGILEFLPLLPFPPLVYLYIFSFASTTINTTACP